MGANRRILDVMAHTTFAHVDAAAVGHDWADESAAVLDVSGTDDGAGVTLELELDGRSLDRVDHHADRVTLTNDQARTLAAALQDAAADDGDDGSGRGRRG